MDELQKAKVDAVKSSIIERFKAPSPVFFKKIIYIAITIGGIGGGLLGLPATGVQLPAQLLTIATYMVTIGAVAAVVAKFTVDADKVK